MKGWKRVKFGELIEDKTSFPLKKGEVYSHIPMENVIEGFRKPRSIDSKEFRGSGSRFKNYDTLFARITPCLQNGKIAYASNLKNGIGFGSTEFFIFRAKKDVTDSKFVYYLSNLRDLRRTAELSMTGASGRQRANIHVVMDYDVQVPENKNDHIRIANTISTYDDLIENNQRRIGILEEMAQRLYTEWFVKFKFPGHEDVKMVDSGTEFGMIPEGWEVKRVDKVIERRSAGKRYNSKTVLKKGLVPVLDQGKSGIIGYHNDDPGYIATEKDPVIVFANHTCYQRLIFFPFSSIQNVLPFKALDNKYDITWLHYATKDSISFNGYKGHWPEFMAKKIVIPKQDITASFGEKAKLTMLAIKKLIKLNSTLSNERDLLIENLVTGKRLLKD